MRQVCDRLCVPVSVFFGVVFLFDRCNVFTIAVVLPLLLGVRVTIHVWVSHVLVKCQRLALVIYIRKSVGVSERNGFWECVEFRVSIELGVYQRLAFR